MTSRTEKIADLIMQADYLRMSVSSEISNRIRTSAQIRRDLTTHHKNPAEELPLSWWIDMVEDGALERADRPIGGLEPRAENLYLVEMTNAILLLADRKDEDTIRFSLTPEMSAEGFSWRVSRRDEKVPIVIGYVNDYKEGLTKMIFSAKEHGHDIWVTNTQYKRVPKDVKPSLYVE